MRASIENVSLEPTPAIAIRETVALASLPAFFAGAFAELDAAVRACGRRSVGPPCARYHSAPPGPIDVEAVFPVDGPVPASGRVQSIELEGGPAIQCMHVGPYDSMTSTYAAIAEHMRSAGLDRAGPPREVYLTDPAAEPDPSTWRTLVVQPVRRG